MDIVLGVSTTPSAVRMVLMEGENADGVTVDQDDFEVDAGSGAVSDRVVSAILGTRESAQQGGYRLTSAGVAAGDQVQAGLLRDKLADCKVGNVTLVSAFLAAAALTQATGGAIGYARTALLFVQPDSATLAVVDSADGAVTEVHRVILPADDAQALAELVGLTVAAADVTPCPAGVFLVGSGVNVGMIKPTLEAASRLPVNVPEEPDLALARGAALASAHTPLLESSTSAVAWARDPGTGAIDPDLAALGYAYISAVPADYDATAAEPALAYSAVGGDDADLPGWGAAETKRRHRPLLLAGSALAALVAAGAATLVIATAVGIRPMASYQPVPVPHVATPVQQEHVPAPPPAAAPAPPPSAPPAPASPPPALLPEVQPAPPAQAPIQPPVPAARQVPAPAPAAPPAVVAPAAPPPAPAPEAPARVPVPAAPAPIPIPIPLPIPILLPAPVPVPAAPIPRPVTPPAAPKPSAPALPPIFNPPTQSPPKTGADWPGTGGGQRRGGLFPGWPGNGGGQHGGGLFPGWPGSGGTAGDGSPRSGGGFPGLGGGGSHAGHGGF